MKSATASFCINFNLWQFFLRRIITVIKNIWLWLVLIKKNTFSYSAILNVLIYPLLLSINSDSKCKTSSSSDSWFRNFVFKAPLQRLCNDYLLQFHIYIYIPIYNMLTSTLIVGIVTMQSNYIIVKEFQLILTSKKRFSIP